MMRKYTRAHQILKSLEWGLSVQLLDESFRDETTKEACCQASWKPFMSELGILLVKIAACCGGGRRALSRDLNDFVEVAGRTCGEP